MRNRLTEIGFAQIYTFNRGSPYFAQPPLFIFCAKRLPHAKRRIEGFDKDIYQMTLNYHTICLGGCWGFLFSSPSACNVVSFVKATHSVCSNLESLSHILSPYSSFSSVSNSNVKTYTWTEILRLRDWCLGRAPSDTGSIPLEIMHSKVRTKNTRPTSRDAGGDVRGSGSGVRGPVSERGYD